MRFVTGTPGPALSPFVECFWSLSDAPEHERERIVPSGTFELVVNLQEDEFRIHRAPDAGACRRFSGAMVSGAYGRPFVIDTRVHASIVGVHFRPGGAHPFFGARSDELADAHVDLESLWGPAAGELRERLCAAVTAAQRFELLESYLVLHLRRTDARWRAVSVALADLRGESASITRLAEHLGMSHRRFIDAFGALVGMTPKRFDRVQRFQRALAQTLEPGERDWTEVALDCGYYDQPHLLRDFVEFSGVTPPEYVRRQRYLVKVNHVAVP